MSDIKDKKQIENLFDFHKLKNSLNVVFLGIQFLQDDPSIDESQKNIISMMHKKIKEIIVQIDNRKKLPSTS